MLKIFALLTIISAVSACSTEKVVCYYGSWAYYRTGNGKFPVESIDPSLCTHLIYAFLGINADGSVRIADSWLDVDLAAFTRFTNLRSQNSNLKTLVAIGGWNEGSTKFSTVASSSTLRATFLQRAVDFLQKWGFDGLDLDWEYPSQNGGASTDKANFSLMLAEFRKVFDEYGFLLTAAVACTAASADTSYEVPELSNYLDFINVMTYDLHGSWDGITGQNAPLYASSIDTTAAQKALNVDAAIQGWISRGAAPEKLILGVGFYGRTFTLSSSSNTALGASISGAGTAGPYTGESGFLGYNEICEKIESGWTVVWDDEQKVPYAYSGNQWVGYDNEKSIALKVDYAKTNGLGGIMIWSVETDDFTGVSGTVNPLLNTIKNNIDSSCDTSGTSSSSSTTSADSITSSASSTTTSTSTTTTTTTTTTKSSLTSTDVCTTSGYVRDLSDCSIFYYCLQSGSTYTRYQFQCPSGLYFNTDLIQCDWSANVSC